MGIKDFEDIKSICNGDIREWKKLAVDTVNKSVIEEARKRTQIEKEFITLKLFWKLGKNYQPFP